MAEEEQRTLAYPSFFEIASFKNKPINYWRCRILQDLSTAIVERGCDSDFMDKWQPKVEMSFMHTLQCKISVEILVSINILMFCTEK